MRSDDFRMLRRIQLVQSDCGRKWTHLFVHTDEGITGIGEGTYSYKETVVAAMVADLKEHVVGRDPFDTESIYDDLYAMAEAYQVVIAPHNTKGPVGIMAAAHVMAAIPNALIQEFIAPSRIPWRNDVLTHPLEVIDSALVVPDRPGLGVEFDAEALKPHLVP